MEKTFVSARLYDKTITVSGFPPDIMLSELLEMFQALSVGLTFSPESWENCIIALAEEYKDTRKYREAQFGNS